MTSEKTVVQENPYATLVAAIKTDLGTVHTALLEIASAPISEHTTMDNLVEPYRNALEAYLSVYRIITQAELQVVMNMPHTHAHIQKATAEIQALDHISMVIVQNSIDEPGTYVKALKSLHTHIRALCTLTKPSD